MDKIRKITQFIEIDENNFSNNEGKVYIYFEDESIPPVEMSVEESYKAYLGLANEEELEKIKEDIERLKPIIAEAAENGTLHLCNSLDPVELEAANAEFEAAKIKAEELEKEKGKSGGVVVPPVVPTVVPTEEEQDFQSEITDDVEVKKHTGLKVGAALLGGVALGAGLYGGIEHFINHNQDIDVNIDNNKNIDFNTGTFEELMNSMDENDVRKEAAVKAKNLVDTFHQSTHKDGNFRLVEDGETYLDFSFKEALVMTTFANYSTPEELYDVLGTYNMTAEEAQNILDSASTKLITYYMNAVEPSGLAEIFENEQDREFFQKMENAVLDFNAKHDTNTSDEVIRNVYYNYILDSSTNAVEVSPMAKLLAFNAVYGGLNLTESASVNHTQFLEFKGMGVEEETKYYVTNVLGKDYSSLSEDEIAQYRENIIEAGTDLVSLLPNGEVMNEENSTETQRNKNLSLTNLVDKLGICNSVNEEINQKMHALDDYISTKAGVAEIHIANVNSPISVGLRDAGLDHLAEKVDASLTSELSAELLNEIRASGAKAANLVSNYETRIAAVNDSNRPSMEQIENAANRELAQNLEYSTSVENISTLINNRRHIPEMHLTEENELTQAEKDKGIIGKDEEGIPIFKQEVIDKVFENKTEKEKEEFIIENGEVIKEETKDVVVQEEVKYEDLKEEEKVVVDKEKIEIFTRDTLNNVYGEGQIAANQYENSSNYVFTPGKVVNPVNGSEYDLNDMNFASAVARAQAFANSKINSETGLIERTANFYIDTDRDTQILNAAEVAAENYLNSLSASERAAVAEGMGMSWEDAKEQLKDSYKDGYIDRMQTAVDLAIQEGNEQFETTLNAQKALIEKNKESAENAYLNPGTATSAAPETVEEKQTVTDTTTNETQPSVEEEQKVVTVPNVQQPTAPETENTQAAPSDTTEEEFDWGAISSNPDEIVIGSQINDTMTTGNEIPAAPSVESEAEIVEETINVSTTSGNIAEENIKFPNTSANVDEETTEEEFDWGAISSNPDEIVVQPGNNNEELDLEAAIQQAYEEALARDAAQNEDSIGGRTR